MSPCKQQYLSILHTWTALPQWMHFFRLHGRPDRTTSTRLWDRASSTRLKDRTSFTRLKDRTSSARLKDRTSSARLRDRTSSAKGCWYILSNRSLLGGTTPMRRLGRTSSTRLDSTSSARGSGCSRRSRCFFLASRSWNRKIFDTNISSYLKIVAK